MGLYRYLRAALVWSGSPGRESRGGLWKTGFPPSPVPSFLLLRFLAVTGTCGMSLFTLSGPHWLQKTATSTCLRVECRAVISPGLVWGRLGFVWGHSWLHHSLPSWLQPSQNLSLPLWPVLLNRSLSQRGQLPGPEILCLGSFIIPTPSNTLDARMSRP